MEQSFNGRGLHRKERAYEADGHLFQMVLEAYRIRAAHLVDSYVGVHASKIEPLPHQITAVYDEMLTRQPLRFLLADDPGAGKTIMAGLLLKELVARGDVERCLIVVPGNLVEQWQSELTTKFGLRFEVFRGSPAASASANPFEGNRLLIARMDMLSRSDAYMSQLREAADWDLVICDEAHRMAASYIGSRVKKTRRYRLGELLGSRSRHFLLMTATPHNGKPDDFRLFMALLDPDRFEGRADGGSSREDVQDLMRRMTKEELLRFDATPLFPERRAYTAKYELSNDEMELYEAVTQYVREEMDRVERQVEGGSRRRYAIGFALQILQRRLASSPAAIHESLRRRKSRLEERLREALYGARIGDLELSNRWNEPARISDWLDEAPDQELESEETRLLEHATAATTVAELRMEIQILQELEKMAHRLRRSGNDTKWQQLNRILDDPQVMGDSLPRKLIIFTEAQDTLTYLKQRIETRLGQPEAVAEIHGGLSHAERQRVMERFTGDPGLRILVATDAAGEGINLQCAHLMVNYDLPWNPNRLEQRFGRIHRIGQQEVCHVWNLVAEDTREGAVYVRLLEKLEQARQSLGGRVYDVLGQVFDAQQLRGLMVEAIRDGQRSEVRDRLQWTVEDRVDPQKLREALENQSLPLTALTGTHVTALASSMQKADAVRMQPHDTQAFFLKAFEHLGGLMHERTGGRWEIRHVPAAIRIQAQTSDGQSKVDRQYPRMYFDKASADASTSTEILGPGHALFDAVLDAVLAQHRDLLRQGTVLVDPAADDHRDPIKAVFLIEHGIEDGQSETVSRQIQFLEIDGQGVCTELGPSPHLDFRPIQQAEFNGVQKTLKAEWFSQNPDAQALAFAQSHLAQPHFEEVQSRYLAHLEEVERLVISCLNREINYWDAEYERAREREKAGRKSQFSSAQARTRADRLAVRREERRAKFQSTREISSLPPAVVARFLVVPQGLLQPDDGDDQLARQEVERIAMEAVMNDERNQGCRPEDVSAEKIGYDIRSYCPRGSEYRFIEVKGRKHDSEHVTLTANEQRTARNSPERFILALVLVKPNRDFEGPHYIRDHDSRVSPISLQYSIKELLATSNPPAG